MHACSALEIDCAHTLQVRVQPSFRHDSIHESVCMQQVFTPRQRTGNRLAQNDIRFVFFLLRGTAFTNPFQVIRKEVLVHIICGSMRKYSPAFNFFLLLGKLGTRQLSQTLSGRKCASRSLRQACEIYSSTFDSLLILGKLDTRHLSHNSFQLARQGMRVLITT